MKFVKNEGVLKIIKKTGKLFAVNINKIIDTFKEITINSLPPFLLVNSIGENLIDYKIYGNSVQDGTPTPDIPVQVESVGDKTKNLASDGLDPIKIASNRQRYGFNFGVLPAGDYTFSFELGDGGTFPEYLYFFVQSPTDEYPVADSSHHVTTTVVRRNPMTFTADGINRYFILMASNADDALDKASASLSSAKNYMLEKGSVKTDYEPNGYKIPVISRGKNLIDYREFKSRNQSLYPLTINNDGSLEYSGDYYIKIDVSHLQSGKTYLLNMAYTFNGELVTARQGTYRFIYEDGTMTSGCYHGAALATDATKKLKDMYCYFISGSTEKYIARAWDIILTEGNTVEAYEPYIEPTETNIYLKEPLRKIGDYTDYIDFEKQEKIRDITRIYADETITYRYDISSNAAFNGEWAVFQLNISLKDITKAYSNKFIQKSYHSYAGYNFWLQTNKTYITFNLKKSDIGATSENTNIEIRELGKQYVKNNPIYFDVVTEQQKETIELPNIPTINGTTILEIDTEIKPSNMVITYKGKQ